jgi:hypothetical protein
MCGRKGENPTQMNPLQYQLNHFNKRFHRWCRILTISHKRNVADSSGDYNDELVMQYIKMDWKYINVIDWRDASRTFPKRSNNFNKQLFYCSSVIFMFVLFNGRFDSSDYVTVNRKITDEWRICKDVKGSSCAVTSESFSISLEWLRNSARTSVRRVCVPAQILTGYRVNTSDECYRLFQLAWSTLNLVIFTFIQFVWLL